MNYALIFAGGTGQRMNTVSIPKQFLKVYDKEIIVHTLEKFQNNENIDKIVVVILEEYINFMKELIKKYRLNKVFSVVAGGNCGQQSIYNGLKSISNDSVSEDDIVLIHDGVRPIIDNDTINKNIEIVREKGNCITVSKAIETIVIKDEDDVIELVSDRTRCYHARAPQSFFVKDIFEAHKKAIAEEKFDFVDSSMLIAHYGAILHTTLGPVNNIKITTPMDYYMFKAILDAKENEQIKVI